MSLRTQMFNFIQRDRTITQLCLIIWIVTAWGEIAENMHAIKSESGKNCPQRLCNTKTAWNGYAVNTNLIKE